MPMPRFFRRSLSHIPHHTNAYSAAVLLVLLAAPSARAQQPTPKSPQQPAQTPAQQPTPTTGKVVGRITDAQTGAPLSDAGVQIVGTTLGTMSTANGQF